ncbi:MAG TPA: DsbA family protein [Gammaproteobacteria bacterium]|nr:DsbA family protein [Gammaproteobacteria bacterium]
MQVGEGLQPWPWPSRSAVDGGLALAHAGSLRTWAPRGTDFGAAIAWERVGSCTSSSSRRALRLAEVAKEDGPAVFYALHRRLFEAYLGEGRNIGDPEVLRAIAEQTGVGPETLERAWSDPRYGARLEQNLAAARELEVTGTPTFFIGESKLVGAVPAANLLHAARLATAG